MRTPPPTAAAALAARTLVELIRLVDADDLSEHNLAQMIDQATSLPELIATLEAALEWTGHEAYHSDECDAVEKRIQAAISRAKGTIEPKVKSRRAFHNVKR